MIKILTKIVSSSKYHHLQLSSLSLSSSLSSSISSSLSSLSSSSSSSTTSSSSSSTTKPTNVVVLGTGALGLYYGGRLLEHELTNSIPHVNVKFIGRNYHKICNDLGYSIKSIDGNISFLPNQVKGKFYNNSITLIDNRIDWIIVTIKSYAITNSIREILDPLVSSNPYIRIILIINGYGVDRLFKEWYGADKVFVTLAFTCINRIFNKDNSNNITSVLIDHIAVGHLLIGHCTNDPNELIKVKELFSNSKIRVETTDSLIKSIWSKLCWNIPFSGLSVAMGAITTDVIAKDMHLRSLATNIMEEVIELANDDIKEYYTDLNIDPKAYLIDQSFKDIMWKYTDDMGVYKTSSSLDLVNNQELEVEYLFTNVWNRAIHHSKKKGSNRKSLYPYIDHLMKTVHAIAAISKQKRLQNVKWTPICWND